MSDRIVELENANRALSAEVSYYRSLLFSHVDPSNASILNALRYAVEQLEGKNEERRTDDLVAVVKALEKENAALRAHIKQ